MKHLKSQRRQVQKSTHLSTKIFQYISPTKKNIRLQEEAPVYYNDLSYINNLIDF